MKKILQDLNFSEVEQLVLASGEKKFRARQLFEGLTAGRKISDISPCPVRLRISFWRNTRTNP